MNKEHLANKIQTEIDNYFDCASKIKCPKSMKKNLYQEISKQTKTSWLSRYATGFATAGLTTAFVAAIVFNNMKNNQQDLELAQAQADLQIAMHYINQVSFKSLSAVNSNGIRPGLIKPLARTYAAL